MAASAIRHDKSAGGSAGTAPAAVANANLETKTISLGFIPILEAAPLVIGVEKGFFAKHGLDVKLSKQANWGAARDNVVLGSAGGGIDGGQWQLPMPQMIGEGAITNGKKVPMYVLAMLMSQGNGIAPPPMLSRMATSPWIWRSRRRASSRSSTRRKAASSVPPTPSPRRTRSSGSATGWPRGAWILTSRWNCSPCPPRKTLQGMKNGTMEAFSTGDPWPSRIARDKIGYLAATTSQMWSVHPEEFLAVRADWVDKHPKAAVALLKGLIEAQMWLDKPENKAEAAEILSSRKWYNVPKDVLEESLRGQYKIGAQGTPVNDPKLGPLYWNSDRGVISYPYKSLTLWFLIESMRWKFYPAWWTRSNRPRRSTTR